MLCVLPTVLAAVAVPPGSTIRRLSEDRPDYVRCDDNLGAVDCCTGGSCGHGCYDCGGCAGFCCHVADQWPSTPEVLADWNEHGTFDDSAMCCKTVGNDNEYQLRGCTPSPPPPRPQLSGSLPRHGDCCSPSSSRAGGASSPVTAPTSPPTAQSTTTIKG